jgi:hypothetical protein
MIGKNIPDEILDTFNDRFMNSFYKAFKYEILNSNKFKIPLIQKEILNYLDKDFTFLSTMIKQRFISP